MTTARGREGKLKPEYAGLYPGLQPNVWLPVETLLQQVTEIIFHDRSKARAIAGTRLLHQDHFEFRGSSARPEGLPDQASRMSDSGAEPAPSQRRAKSSGTSRPNPGDDTHE
jgi:hypothetical protein